MFEIERFKNDTLKIERIRMLKLVEKLKKQHLTVNCIKTNYLTELKIVSDCNNLF